MLDVPTRKEEVGREAFAPFRVLVPTMADPFLKVIISPSAGKPAADHVIAVKVTGWPAKEGFREEVTTVLVVAPLLLINTPAALSA
jgi:hypothetical protein